MPCFLFKISFPRGNFVFALKKQEELEAEFYFYFFVGWLAVEWKKKTTPTQKVERKFHGMVVIFGNPEPTSPMSLLKMRWLVGSSCPLNI